MLPKKTESANFSITTTRTMREKAHLVSRFVINSLKCWRICCRKKNTVNVIEVVKKDIQR